MTTQPRDVLVRCQDAGRTFGRGPGAVVAMYGVTCEVAAGDWVAIVGPSGSGKSTLLHVMAGLESTTVGRIEWPGLDSRPRDPGRVGLAFQSPSLISTMTVLENVELPLLLAGCARDEARDRAADALTLLGLAGLADDLPQQVSAGQAQRAVMARVLAARPPLILADEPTSRLDRRTAERLTDTLLDVSDAIGAALVVATHDESVAARMATVWPMRDGTLRHRTMSGAGGRS